MDQRGPSRPQPARDRHEGLTMDTLTRRSFLGRGTTGIGSLALASLLDPRLLRAADEKPPADRWTGVVNPPHFAPKAKRLIYLYMAGGPSHLETLDYKPKLAA